MFLRRDHVLVKSVEVKFLGPGFQCVRVPVEFEGSFWEVFVFVHSSVIVAVFLFSVLEGRSLWFFLFLYFNGSGSFFCPVVRFLGEKKRD